MTSLVQLAQSRLYLLGDVHARLDLVQALLERAQLLENGRLALPGDAALIQVGDLIDRDVRFDSGRLRAGLAARVESLAATPTPRVPDADGKGRIPLRELARRLEHPATPAEHGERLALEAAVDAVSTLRWFMEAQASGAAVVCLLGNHEIDLLRGRFLYKPRQKAFLLALCGVPADDIAAHASTGRPASEVAGWSDELRWIAALPCLVQAGALLVVHGGPPRALLDSLDVLGVDGLLGLAGYLDEARSGGFDHAAFAEGRSLFSPDGQQDDMVRAIMLARRFLALADARTVAVGHSPFLHFPKGRWQDLADPQVRARVDKPALLGPQGEVLKLDTNLKRDGEGWIVVGDREAAAWHALGVRGEELALTLESATRPASAIATSSAPEEGVDSDELDTLMAALEVVAAEAPEVHARTEAALWRWLAAGATELAPVMAVAEAGKADRTEVLERLEALVSEAHARLSEAVAAISARLRSGETVVLALIDGDRSCVQGRWLHLGPHAAHHALAQTGSSSLVITASCFRRGEQPYARLLALRGAFSAPQESLLPLPGWPPDAAALQHAMTDFAHQLEAHAGTPPARPRAEPAGGKRASGITDEGIGAKGERTTQKVVVGPPLAAAERAGVSGWVEANAVALGAPATAAWSFAHVMRRDGAGIQTHRFVAVHGDRTWLVLKLPDGTLVPGNTAFLDPASRFAVVDGATGGVVAQDHAEHLVALLEGDPVDLFSAVDETVACLFEAGELEQLGLADGRRPVWQRGRFLFASPDPNILAYFTNKSQRLMFRLPRRDLHQAVRDGLLNINLFLSDAGEALSREGELGARDVGLEVVAIGIDGLSWLRQYLVQQLAF